MTEYISKEVARRIIDSERTREQMLAVLSSAVPTDVRENKHGKWELAEDGWFCTACELYAPFDCDPEEKGIPFCPWCGAELLKGEIDVRKSN